MKFSHNSAAERPKEGILGGESNKDNHCKPEHCKCDHHKHRRCKLDPTCLILGLMTLILIFETKHEIREIEKKLDNPNTGLGEIKKEVRDIEHRLDNPETGLEEIKREVREIEGSLNNPHTGLVEIKREIREIEGKLDNPDFGLAEIKREIKIIEQETVGSSILTTGPVIRSTGVGNLYVKMLNNTNSTQQIRINLFNLDVCPKLSVEHRLITVPTLCADLQTFDIGPSGHDLREFEVEIEFLSGITRGIYAYIAGAQGNSFNLDPSNVFRHVELAALLTGD